MFNSLRDFIAHVEASGEVKHVDGADWDLEIGLITEIEARSASAKLLLFDNIKGHESGFRVACNLFNTTRLVAMAYGLPEDTTGMELVRAMKNARWGTTPIPRHTS